MGSEHGIPRVPTAKGDLVETVARSLSVIEAFDDDHARLTVSELAARVGMSRPAARRYLLTLASLGYADTDGKQFWLRPRVLRLGQSYLASARLPTLVQPFVQRVAMQVGEPVNFSVLDGHDVVYLVRSAAQGLFSIGFQVGVRAPAHVVAPGVVSLGTLADDVLDEWIAEHPFTRFTPKTVTDPRRFREQVLRARELDYWLGDSQGTSGLLGLAVAVRSRKGEYRGAIGLTWRDKRFGRAQVMDEVLPALREAAQALRPLV
jgi:IclR family pca regulon transcriptional regulator